jgi:hypothetical protein
MKTIIEAKEVINFLKKQISVYYSDKAENVDKNIKNDNQAIRMLTVIENNEIKDYDVIESFENLCERFLPDEYDFAVSLKYDAIEKRRK